jgi:hypothetical protein
MLEGISIGDLGAGTLVGIFFLLMFLGRIKPKSDVDRAEEAAEKWRLAYEAEREARALSDAQTAELLELAQTTHQIIVAMFGTAQRIRHSGGANAISSSED